MMKEICREIDQFVSARCTRYGYLRERERDRDRTQERDRGEIEEREGDRELCLYVCSLCDTLHLG